MRIFFFVCMGLLATGCVSTNETYTASGQKGHVISCTPGWTGGLVGSIANASTNWGTCYQKAGEICGTKGYIVLTRSDEPTFAAHAAGYGYGDSSRVSAHYGASAATSRNRMMIVQCKQGTATAQVK
jgi:hypothetical protein